MKTVRIENRRRMIEAIAAGLVAAQFLVGGAVALAEDIPEAATKEADMIWSTRCVTCHGSGGKGDGAAAAALTPPPRDLTSPAWQTSVTDEHIAKIIAGGGQAVGLSMLMPANPDIASKPDVIRALTAKVRGLAAK